MQMTRWFKGLVAVSVVGAAVTIAAEPARAAEVVVPPGGSGHTCSSYRDIPGTGVFWQACAWADNNEVYFTGHFGNNGSSGASIDFVDVNYIKNGQKILCYPGVTLNLYIPARGYAHTNTLNCVLPRSRGAYAADVTVEEGTLDPQRSHSPNLQVQ